MKVGWKVFAVCVFAIAASYLITSIPFASAAQVTISYGGSSQTTTYSPETYIAKQVTIDGTTGAVGVQVSNGSSNAIDSVHVYKCQARDPSSCSLQVIPLSFSGSNVDVTYAWNDVSDAAQQTANIMLIVHTVDSSGGRWLSFWSHGTKTAGSPYSIIDSSISSIAISARDISYIPSIRSFIDTRGMLPMNPAWISSILFSGAADFYDIETSNPPASGTQVHYTGNSITNITGSYAFLFPYNGVYTLNGVTIANTSNYIIGDGTCSAGEPSDLLGCIDCGVPSDYYCDVSRGPKQLNSISLSTSSSSIKVSNCNVANTISLSFTVVGMPTGTTVQSAQYALNGSASASSACSSAGGNVFTCSITTPAVPGCSGADYVLTPNSMTFSIRFNNASSYMTKSLTASLPTITVGSWTCGQLGCETGLGESQANCCYDCGCPSGQYCDFATGQPATSACKAPLLNTNLQVVSASPLNFYTHNAAAGDNVQMELHITNAPQSVSVSSSGCRINDCLKSGLPCAANCSISCLPKPSTNPNIYNSTCSMNFMISVYDVLQNYTIYPIISNTMSYNNGTGGQIAATLEVNGPVVSVGSHWRGDGKCDPDETYATVCFDCPCPSGQYCDSASKSFSTASDVCRQASGLNVTLDGMGSTNLVDSSMLHAISIGAHIDGKPHGLAASGYCSFNGSTGAPACSMSCSVNETATGYGIGCILSVPAISYKSSPFYDAATRKITLPNNTFGIVLSFNDGARTSSVNQSFALPDVVIDVVPHCGDGSCDADIGESPSTCCLDCNCTADMFCYGSVSSNVCLDNSAVYLFINRTNPAEINCTIAYYKGKCQFVQPVDIYTDIINVPVGARLIASSYEMDNQSYGINCFASPIGQNAKFICSTALPEIAGESGGAVGKSFSMIFTIRYTNNGTDVTKNISANATLGVDRQKSQRVMDCEKAISDAKGAKSKVSSKTGILMGFLAVTGVIAAFACANAVFCCVPHPAGLWCSWGCPAWVFICGLALMLVGCLGGMLNSAVEKAKAAAQQAEDKRAQLCASDDPASMRAAQQGAKGAASSGLGTALGIICAIGIVVAIIGAFMLIAAAAPAAGGAMTVNGAAAAPGTAVPVAGGSTATVVGAPAGSTTLFYPAVGGPAMVGSYAAVPASGLVAVPGEAAFMAVIPPAAAASSGSLGTVAAATMIGNSGLSVAQGSGGSGQQATTQPAAQPSYSVNRAAWDKYESGEPVDLGNLVIQKPVPV